MKRRRKFILTLPGSYLEALAPLVLVVLIFLMYHFMTRALVSCGPEWGTGCQPVNVTQFFKENGLCCLAPAGALKGEVMQGRFLWLFMTGLNFLACFATVAAGIYIVAKVLAGRPRRYQLGFAGSLALLTLLALFFFLGRDDNISRLVDCPTGYETERLVNQYLACTATTEMPSVIAVSNWTIALSYTAAFLLVLLSGAILWPVPSQLQRAEKEKAISERIKLSRVLLYTGMLQLVISTLRLNAAFRWSQSFLPPAANNPASKALEHLAATLGSTEAATYTLILVAIYLPALFILRNRACTLINHEECPTPPAREKWLQERGLSISISAYVPRLAAILAPLLAGPLGDMVARFLNS
jgi:hypothetical protein